MSKDREDFDANEWGNIGSNDILDPKWNRRRTKEQYADIASKVKKTWNTTKRKKHSRKAKKINLDIYGVGTYIVRSPGNDLLDFYDMMHKRKIDAPKSNITPIPPSRIFQFRFETELPDVQGANQFSGPTQVDVFREVCSPYADNMNSVKISTDKYKLFNWLVDKPSMQKEFKLRQHAVDYLSKIKGSKQRGIDIVVHSDTPRHEQIFWKGPLAGWSIVFIPEKD